MLPATVCCWYALTKVKGIFIKRRGAYMKGIVLAGGAGTRLHPLTIPLSKQLLPVYDKPMVYYPISLLMIAGIRDILIISTPHDLPLFEQLLGDGSQFGVSFSYAEQPRPEGLSQAFIVGADFCGDQPVALVLGDNILYGQGLTGLLRNAATLTAGALAFAYYVREPQRYGVVEFDKDLNVVSIEEKPEHPKSNYVIPGLYFYDNDVVSLARTLKPSARGELEITDLNNLYLKEKKLQIRVLGRGVAWLDTGNIRSLMDANMYVQAVEERQGLKIACLEEIGLRQGWLTLKDLQSTRDRMGNSVYAAYLKRLIDGEILWKR